MFEHELLIEDVISVSVDAQGLTRVWPIKINLHRITKYLELGKNSKTFNLVSFLFPT